MGKLIANADSDFSKNVLTLFTGNAVAFVVPVILYPVLSRIFEPEDYLLYGLYVSTFGFLEIGSAGRYDFAVVLPEKEEDSFNIVAGGLIISVFYSLLVLLFVALLGNWAAAELNNPQFAKWLFVLPLSLLLASTSKLFNSWLIRKKQFRAASINKASQKLSESLAQMAFGILKIGNGLILGDVFGRLFNSIAAVWQSINGGFRRDHINRSAILAVLKRYSEFPKFNILPSMLNALASMIPVLIISSRYLVEISGSFNFSRIILSVPFALIATGVSQVLMQQVSSRQHRKEPIAGELSLLGVRLAILSIVAVIVLYFGAPWLFEMVFGEKWRQAGEYTSILIFSNAISFVVSPFSILLAVLGKLRFSSSWQTFYFIANCSLWFFDYSSIENFLVILVMVDIVAYLIYGALIYVAVKHYEDNLIL